MIGTRHGARMDRDLVDVASGEPSGRQPLVLTRDPEHVQELTRLCAAAAVTADVVGDPAAAASRWAQASCVLVGEDCAPEVAALGMRRRDDVVLVGRDLGAAGLWQRGVQIGAAEVVVLPRDAGRITDRLAEAAASGNPPGVVVGVVGAGGGAGASTVAASLATAHARGHDRSLLVDADALGGGLELIMGCETAPGLRWSDIDVGEGRVAASSLLAALPSVDGVSVLSVSRSTPSDVDATVLRTMVSAGRRACSLVVVDLPRRLGGWLEAVAPALDITLIVVTTEIRSTSGGRHLAVAVRGACPDLRAVVRTTSGGRLEPDAVAEAIGLPLAGSIPTRSSVSRAADDGIGVLHRRRDERRYDALLASLRPSLLR
jgi:secretion/DNA translocation related CpaE-like protein